MTTHEIRVWNEADLWELMNKLGAPRAVILEEHKNWKEIYDYTLERDISKRGRRARPPEWRVELIESVHITLVWDHLIAGCYVRGPRSQLNLRLNVSIQMSRSDWKNMNRHLRPKDARGHCLDKEIWLYGREACYDEELLLTWLSDFKKKFKSRRRFRKVPIVKGKLRVPEPRYYEEY